MIKNKRLVAIAVALTFFIGSLSTTPVYASTKLTDNLKEAYISTLETRTTWGDPEDLCRSGVDTATEFKEYYKALEAYEEDEDSAYYGLTYSIASKSTKNGTTALGKPVDSVEYAVVGTEDEDGEPQVTVYKCTSTTWLKKIDGEYQITKVNRSIRALEDYENEISDSAIAQKVTALCEGYLSSVSANSSEEEAVQVIVGSTGSELSTKAWSEGTVVAKRAVAPKIIISSCPENVKNSTVKISGMLVGRTASGVTFTINGTTVPVNSKTGNWSASVNLSEGTNTLVFKAVNSDNQETMIQKTVYYSVPTSVVNTQKKINPPLIKITKTPTFASGDVIRIQGSVSDESGTLPAMYVNGQQLDVSADGSWTADITLTSGENEIIFKAVNADGKEYTQKKRIRYTP